MMAVAASPTPPAAGSARRRGRPPLAEADVASRRQRIVDTAYRMFIANGFARTTLEAIGREAGVTKRTIYELIGDKQTLFELSSTSRSGTGPHFAFDVPVAGRAVRPVLEDAARSLLEHSFETEIIGIQRTVLIESAHYPELARDILIRGKRLMMEMLASVFEELITHDIVGPIDTMRASEVFFDAIVGARGFRAALGHPDSKPSEADLQERVTMFLTGYLAQKTTLRDRNGHRAAR